VEELKKELESKTKDVKREMELMKSSSGSLQTLQVPLRPDLNPVCMDSDVVRLDDQRLYLTSLLAPFGNKTNLLYRGSRDGWTSEDFHRQCDN